MTIVDFLLARITEDEEQARRGPGPLSEDWQVVARWREAAAARVLAECQAKRAIVEEHRGEVGYVVAYRESDRLIAEGYDLDTVPLRGSAAMIPACLRHLAAVYADHPAYDPAWQVE